jgi:hypothetical protein
MPKMVVSRDHTLFAGVTESGATLSADAQLLAESPAAADQFTQQCLDILVAGRSLAVSMITTDAEDGGLQVVGSLLRDAAASANTDAAGIALTVRAGRASPPQLWRARVELLGSGLLFVTSGSCEADWRALWDLRHEPDLRIAEATEVTSACRLLAAESATVVVPGLDVQGPVGSAWVSRRIWLPGFVTPHGEINEDALLQAAVAAVESAELDIEATRWPTPRMRHDAWLNRRLAVEIAGIGSLVARLGLDPAEFSTLLMANNLVARLRETIVRQSRQLAALRGPVPALEQAGKLPSMSSGRLRDGWLRRWQQAVDSTAQRHRNLVVLSPWSLFPEDVPAPYAYANLVPLLRYADACALPRPPDISGWTFTEFVNFHRQVTAVLQQRFAQRQIAEPA